MPTPRPTGDRPRRPHRAAAARPAGTRTYRGRTLTGIAPRPYSVPVVIVGEHAPGTPAAEQRNTTVHGAYGQHLSELLGQVRTGIDALDAAPLDAFRAQREPWWYDPATIETCPRSAKSAHPGPLGHLDLHARRKGEDCTDPDCATRRRKAARRKATSYGITGPSVSALLGAAGFEARTNRNPGGFAAEGDAKARCVWLHTGRQDTERLTTALTGRGVVVTPGPGGPGSGVLRILARVEAEHQGIDLPTHTIAPAPALPSTAGIRAALRRAGLPLATDRDGAPDAGSGLRVGRGRPGEWVVGWSAGHDRDGGDAWRARNARRAEMTAAAAESLRAGYTLEVEQREGWTPRITVTGRRPALT